MSLDINKWSDHLLLLHSHAQGLLTALYCAKQFIDPEATSPTSDILARGGSPDVSFTYNGSPVTPVSASRPALERLRVLAEAGETGLGDFFKKIVKKFPDVGDITKSSSYQAFVKASDSILEELKPYYDLLSATAEFAETALTVLQQGVNLLNLSFDTNPEIVNAFLDLLVSFVSIIYLVTKQKEELNWIRLSKFISTYDKPLPAIQENLAILAPRIMSILLELKPQLTQRLCISADGLRKTAVLSLTPEMSGVKAPEPDMKHLQGLAAQSRYFAITVIGFLLCPGEVVKNPNSIDHLKLAFSYAHVLPLVRNETLDIPAEYEANMKANSKLGKILKNDLLDALASSHINSPAFHKERRDYLRHQLRQILCLCDDHDIITTRFMVIVSAIGFAKDEILWYFHHLENDLVGKKKGKKEPRSHDVGVMELMWLLKEICRHLMQNVDVIRDAMANHVAGLHVPGVLEIIDNALQSPELAAENTGLLLRAIGDSLAQVPTERLSEVIQEGGLEAVRLNWLRFQVCAALPTSVAAVPGVADLSVLMGDLFVKSRWLDKFSNCIKHYSSLHGLCYYQTPLQELLRECMDTNPESMRFVGVLGVLAEEFMNNVSPCWPTEQKQLSIHSVLFATEVYSILGQYAANIAHDIALKHIDHETQVLPQDCLALLPRDILGAGEKHKKKGVVNGFGVGRKPIGERFLQRPGWESAMKGESGVKSLEKTKMLLRNIIAALSNPPTVVVHDSEFHPFEFFLECLAAKFKTFLMSSVYKLHEAVAESHFLGLGRAEVAEGDEPMSFDVKRPSLFLAEARAYLAAMQYVDNFVPVDCTELLREVLLGQIDFDTARALADAQPDQMVYQYQLKDPKVKAKEKSKPPVLNTNQSLLVTYMVWYCEFIGSKATTGNICFAPNRRSFVSKSHLQFQTELYTDVNELRSLCELLGPQGIRFIDDKLVRVVASITASLKDVIVQNQEALERLKVDWDEEGKSLEALRKLRAGKDVTTRLITIGYILEFRKLLLEAVTSAFGGSCEHILSCVRTAGEQYVAFGVEQQPDVTKTIGMLSDQLGLLDKWDYTLSAALSAVTADIPSADTLPHLFAASLWSMAFDDYAVFNPYINGLENNGHCITTAYDALTRHLLAPAAKENVDIVPFAHREFVSVASTFLMRLKQETKEKDLQTKNLDSCFMVLQQFIKTSPYISADIAEDILPTSLVTGIAVDLHRRYNEVVATGTKKVISPGVGTGSVGTLIVGEDDAAM
ncbi:Nck-associated protein 1 [Rhizophlyctis rosea]|uniref:Nck-associated protein 1 n=1 Tax=Rhizophlyctis rosea TaxID=64517 RepID=A0AAD5SDV4_9FUNG|nr:Nck-associated protein 1 [Rhizophlyctis rosea]